MSRFIFQDRVNEVGTSFGEAKFAIMTSRAAVACVTREQLHTATFTAIYNLASDFREIAFA